jgi:hypothetical protein
VNISVSERTFGQILEKARQLLAYIQNLPGYNPTEVELQPAAFDLFLKSVALANEQKDAAEVMLRNVRAERKALYTGADGLASRVTQVRDYLASLPAGKKSVAFKQVQKLVQQIRLKPSRTTKKDAAEKPKREISSYEVSFGARLEKARQIEQIILAEPGYAPSNPAITAAGIDALLDAIDLKNAEVAAKEAIAKQKIENQRTLYYGKNGLIERAARIKAAIAAIFGRQSDAYKNAVRIRIR